jgi:quercetin 2,3-dioxygenase
MITLRPGNERGHFDFGWLDTRHTFSFGRYVDRRWTSFSALRVINDDLIAPGMGFGLHPHDSMEIISYVVAGELAHRDTLGNTRTIGVGEVQAMSAGTGLEHSEFNPSATTRTRLVQVWIRPASFGTPPSYDQKKFMVLEQPDRVHVLVSPDGRDGSLRMLQDAVMRAALFVAPSTHSIPLAKGRSAWVQVVGGSLELDGHTLRDGDGAGIVDQERFELRASGSEPAHVLLFDLP